MLQLFWPWSMASLAAGTSQAEIQVTTANGISDVIYPEQLFTYTLTSAPPAPFLELTPTTDGSLSAGTTYATTINGGAGAIEGCERGSWPASLHEIEIQEPRLFCGCARFPMRTMPTDSRLGCSA